MKHSIFGYLLGEGFRNVFHNKKSSGASLAIMCATMLIFGLFFMIIENLNNAVETLETQQGIQVFIQKTATDAQMEQIGEQIQAIDGVNKVTFVSKEDALNQTKEKLKDKQALIAGWDESNPFKASYLVTLTDLKLSSQVQDEIKKICIGEHVMSAQDVVKLCTQQHKTVASCESLTAGLFSSTIASIPGASAVLKGGLVTYFTEMKKVLAHVDADLIDQYGVVSEECACAMAKNTRQIMDVDYCVSFTGNAGPSSMEGKPAGCVYCAIATKEKVYPFHFQYDCPRNEVRANVVREMITQLENLLK